MQTEKAHPHPDINLDPNVSDASTTPKGFTNANGNVISHRTSLTPFKVPYYNPTPVITPQQQKTPPTENGANPTLDLTTGQETAKLANDNNNANLTTRILLPHSGIPYKVYDSTLLNNKYKPNPDQLELPLDLEPLKPLILLLQHAAFTSTLKELGTISTTHTKVIEKKEDSYYQLKNNNKIPRSLRLKCTLTTTQSFADNTDFLRLKEALDNKISTFIKEGSSLMTEWAATNIQLLITDRCHNILQKEIKILDGLIAYTSDVIGTPSWPSVTDKDPIL